MPDVKRSKAISISKSPPAMRNAPSVIPKLERIENPKTIKSAIIRKYATAPAKAACFFSRALRLAMTPM
ncbi:hypothetical protein WG622_17165 [Cognatishimia sp. D5M38]|uniref:Uncharacterized protein n=1 Tax=Cognatishimia coralii TaxID=3083254 RepID=A0ABU8QKR2_9RHOB